MTKTIKTDMMTYDGLRVYDLDPQSSELWVVAGPDDWTPAQLEEIDTDNLPTGFRWVDGAEWERLQAAR